MSLPNGRWTAYSYHAAEGVVCWGVTDRDRPTPEPPFFESEAEAQAEADRRNAQAEAPAPAFRGSEMTVSGRVGWVKFPAGVAEGPVALGLHDTSGYLGDVTVFPSRAEVLVDGGAARCGSAAGLVAWLVAPGKVRLTATRDMGAYGNVARAYFEREG